MGDCDPRQWPADAGDLRWEEGHRRFEPCPQTRTSTPICKSSVCVSALVSPVNGLFTWINVPIVQFVVFAPSAFAPHLNIDDFFPSTAAILDSEGAKAVPGVCMACHNGSDNGAHPSPTLGPRFLPFDTPSFLYDAANSGFSSDSQIEKFRILNEIVRDADTDGGALVGEGSFFFGAPSITSQTIRDLIAGWYSWCGGVDHSGCKIDDVGHPFIPTGACTSAGAPATCGWTDNGLYGLAYQQISRVSAEAATSRSRTNSTCRTSWNSKHMPQPYAAT